jgi:type II secretory pathway component PulF
MFFYVKAVSLEGEQTSEIVEFQDYDALLQNLDHKGFFPSKIVIIPNFIAPLIPKGGTKIKSDEVVELMENLHLVMKAGLPLHQGLLDIAKDTENKRFRNMLEQIAYDVNNGKSLSDAFSVYESVVGTMILNLIRIGEETGELETTLLRGAEFLKRTTSLKKKAKSALIYPSFAFTAVFGAMLVWMIYVLPQMTELFKEMDVELPAITVFLIELSHFLSNYIGYLLLGFALFIIAFKFAHKKYRKVRKFVDKIVLKIPVIKQIVSGFNIAFTAEYLRLALISGVPIFNALETLNKNINNELFKEALHNATNDVAKGAQLSHAFAKTKIFTPFMLRMMSVGESAGTLDAQLNIISKYYYDRVDFFAENIGKVIEPVILFFVGGFMALIMIGLMGPMYDLVSNMK